MEQKEGPAKNTLAVVILYRCKKRSVDEYDSLACFFRSIKCTIGALHERIDGVRNMR